MDIINSMIWLVAGVMIGWFANRFIAAQSVRQAEKPELLSDDLSLSGKNTELLAASRLSNLPATPEDESFKEQFFANDSLGG